LLVLTRKNGEVIRIGDDITVTLIWASDGRARIGISAPANIRIDRPEVRAKVEREGYRPSSLIDEDKRRRAAERRAQGEGRRDGP
jgi:carbon storage regulator